MARRSPAEWAGGVVQHPWLAAQLAARSRRVLFAAPTPRPQVALTFDDAPHEELTPALLDVLDRHRATATFFCLGSHAAARPELVEELVRRGHEVGNHLWEDRPSVLQSAEEFRRDLLRTHDVLVTAGARPRFLRPGSGWVRPSMLRTVGEHGYQLALGSIAVLDLTVSDVEEQQRFVARRLQPGAVIVLHEGYGHRSRVVPLTDRILTVLAERGLEAVSLSDLHDGTEGIGEGAPPPGSTRFHRCGESTGRGGAVVHEQSGADSRVVVGVDRSPASRDALRYALAAAARSGASVEAVATYPPPRPWASLRSPADPGVLFTETTRRTTAFLADVLGSVSVAESPELRAVAAHVFVSEGPAAAVLLERAKGARLLVVGSHGHGPVHSALLGSVALHCATQADCPVVVVHAESGGSGTRPEVVVGIDGSPYSRAALLTGLEEAGRRGGTVEAVAAYGSHDEWTDLYSYAPGGPGGIAADVERGARTMTDEVTESVRAAGGHPVAVRTVVVEGHAADVLVQRSSDAQLLVLGSRGLSGVRGLLLGSVTLRCLARAACPVMVVRPRLHAWEGPGEEPAAG